MIVRLFGAQERKFILLVAPWRDLEKNRNAGLGAIAQRLAPLVQLKANGIDNAGGLFMAVMHGAMGAALMDDVRETLLQGLIGGGMTATEAGALVAKIFDGEVAAGKGPVLNWCDLAFDIVMAALIGLPDEPRTDQPGEPKADATPAKRARSKTAKPASATSTQRSAP